MPIDEYKTQVLLLHSEQTALDTLSAGFGDRYTVHCATSGSEALNTMIDTPINVIITAQELPGMSGQEALREAIKRSPETIGILLAGSGGEAIVGDEEVFQVVHGDVTSDGLKQLVDNATQQVRLMALAESANDTAADPDLTSEHIVMETSDNGSTIISDGTGRLPVLDPKKISAAQAVGARSVDVLVLTKDQEFLETIKDSAQGMHDVHYANTLSEADKAIREHKVGVAVVDAAMVGEKVEKLTLHLRKTSPRLVSIVAGRRDDGEMLMDLINRGKVYRFLLKPVSPGRARLAVEASAKHHLEAPDSAFKTLGGGAQAPAAKPQSAPASKAKPAAPSKAKKPKKKPSSPPKNDAPVKEAAKSTAPASDERRSDPPLGAIDDSAGDSAVADGLSDAFGSDDGSFTETVTGIVSSFVGKTAQSDPDLATEPKQSEPAESGTSILQPKTIGLAAAAAVVVAAGIFWITTGSDDAARPQSNGTATESPENATPEAAVAADPGTVVDEAPLGGSGVDDDLVQEARAAREAGQIYNPIGSNALELYAAALAADPGNDILAAELDATVGEALAMAEAAMLESRVDDADAALARVTDVNPGNARLPFLTAQLTQMQLRERLDNARVAIRENRFEDAATAIAAARGLGDAGAAEVETVAAELSAARSAQQVGEVLTKANERLESGSLITPANDNARYYYDLVLSAEPGNTAATQGLNVVASKLVLQARSEIDTGKLDDADRTLAEARNIDPSSADLASTLAALQNARDAIVERQRLAAEAEAARIAEQERLAAEAEAARIAEQERLAAEAEAEAERIAEQERLAAESEATESSEEPRPEVASASLDPAGSADKTVAGGAANSGFGGASIAPATKPVPVQEQPPVAVSSLARSKYVAPKYPRSAQRRNLSGWVDIVFTVTFDGSVRDIEVLSSEPGEIFVNAASNAVERWEFEPIVENGQIVEKRAGVRMMFALE